MSLGTTTERRGGSVAPGTGGGRSRRAALATAAVVVAIGSVFTVSIGAQGAEPPSEVNWTAGHAVPSSWMKRWDPAVAYHPPSETVVLFGGSPAVPRGTWFDDTWLLRDDGWESGPAAPPGLTPRGGAAIAYHPASGDLVMFGGSSTAWPPYDQTWLYDGTGWRRGPDAPPGLFGRVGAQIALHPPTGDLVMFGGSGDAAYLDTWLYDGTGWRPGPAPASNMRPRAFGGMAWDAGRGEIILAGGSGGYDVWAYDGDGWAAAPPFPEELGPKERVDIEYHHGFERTVVFGGLGPGYNSDELWYLDADTWRRLDPPDRAFRPDSRLDGHLVWIDHRDEMLLVGGVCCIGTGRSVYRDTWWMN